MTFHYFEVVAHADHNREYLFPTLRIAHISKGAFDWEIGGNTYSLKEGDTVLLNNLLPRTIKNQTLPVSHIDVFEFLPIELQKRPLLAQAFYSKTPNIIFYQSEKLVSDLLFTISKTYKSRKNQSCCEHIMQAVLDLIEETFCLQQPHSSYSDLTFQSMNYIWGHFADDITVSSVASHLHISKNHLEKIFKQTYGISVGMYIRSIRIYHVTKLLECSHKRSVLDIALSCGFKSSSGFYKTYKSLVGTTPKNSQL